MHAYAFLIRETKIGSSLCSVFPLGFLWELVIREERFWNFYGGVVTRRHSFGFSRNNMKGALTIGEIQWVRNIKRKISNFSFWRCQGLRDEVPNVLRFLYEVEKRLNAPSKFDGSAGDNLQNGFNKIAEIRRNYFVIVL